MPDPVDLWSASQFLQGRGLTRDGLPIGMQIAGPRFAVAPVLRAARAYEAARGPFTRPPLT